MEIKQDTKNRLAMLRPSKWAAGVATMLLSASILAACTGGGAAPAADATATMEPAATAEVATPEASEPMTDTEGMDDSESMTDTEGMDDSETMTDTEGMDDSESMTDTEGMDDSEGMTDTEGVGDSEEITGTEEVTGTDTTTN